MEGAVRNRFSLLAAICTTALVYSCPASAQPDTGFARDLRGAQPFQKDFKSWVVACDNTRACSAQPDLGALGNFDG
jgi:hypothetical protein